MTQAVRSEKLDTNYIPLEEGYLTDKGVLFKKGEVVSVAEHEKRLKGTLYDYAYAQSTGFLRKKVGQKEDTEEERSLDFTRVLKTVSFLISLATMSASVYFTGVHLMSFFHPILAFMLSTSMVAFTTLAFEAIVLFYRNKQWAFMGMFILLFPVVVLYSMSTTVAVTYDAYDKNQVAQLDANKETNTNRIVIAQLKEEQGIKERELAMSDEAIKVKRERIEYYTTKEWGILTLQRELEALLNDKTNINSEVIRLGREIQRLTMETPDAVLTKEVVREDFYTMVGKLVNKDASTVSFVISIFPAVFIDIVAPLAMAITLFI